MIASVPPREMPAFAGNRFYLDYIDGTGTARRFFAHVPDAFGAALEARAVYPYPRSAVASLAGTYNACLGAGERALDNARALADPGTFCVITGQQVGFLGGPAYTAFKTLTAIRLAAHLEGKLGKRFVPVFWLASEDHDFREINHAHLVKRDGEVGRVAFDWTGEGRPVSALPVTDGVLQAWGAYWSDLEPSPHQPEVREAFSPHAGEDYTTWHARVWSELFAKHGLVIVEPRTLRAQAGSLFEGVLHNATEIRRRLDEVAQWLVSEGYEPQLTSDSAGQLYTFDSAGNRVRVTDPGAHVASAAAHPEQYSTDAALRPLFADAMLPIVASVLGPGETAYQAMLKPLYELLGVPQPLSFPRKGYTVVSERESERLAAYGVSPPDVLREQIDADAVIRSLLPVDELEMFAAAQRGVTDALLPLRPYLEDVDPSLGKTWTQTLANADRQLEKLRERAMKARLSQLGFSKGELRRLRNALLPRGRLQERVLPLPHFLARHGEGFLDVMMSAGDLLDPSHHILTLRGAGG